MQVLIVEDELLLSRRLKNLLFEIDSNIQIAGVTASVEETVRWLRNHSLPELIFMDIELGDGKSFDILKQLKIDVPVIFTTAYDEFALQAFKVNSIDYLLKPIKKDELQAAIDKFKKFNRPAGEDETTSKIDMLLEALNPQKNKFRERFLIRKGHKMISVDIKYVAYFTIHNTLNYLITCDKQRFMIDYTLDELEAMLDPSIFFRANRQFILTRQIIQSILPWFNSKLKVELNQQTDDEIIISREKAKQFKEWMGE